MKTRERDPKLMQSASTLLACSLAKMQTMLQIPEYAEYAYPQQKPVLIKDWEFRVDSEIQQKQDGTFIRFFLDGIIDSSREEKHAEMGSIILPENISREEAEEVREAIMEYIRWYRNDHMDNFKWIGYDFRFFENSSEKWDYGETRKTVGSEEEAVSIAKDVLEKYKRYIRAVVVNNATGETAEVA